MDMTVIITKMIVFFIIMGVGYTIYKIGIMDADFNKKLTNLVLRVTMPCMMVSSAFSVSEDRDIKKVLSVFAIAIIMYSVLPALGMLFAKIIRCKPENTGIYVFMTIFTNVGFMGFPVIEAMLGKEALFYTAIFNMIFNFCLFTVGVKAINYPDKGNNEINIKKVLLHPGVVSAFLAIVIYFSGIKLPGTVTGAIDWIGSITSPVAMLLMGASLAKIPLNKVFNEVRIYFFIIIKQIILPLVAWFALKGIIKDEIILLVTFVMICMPTANTSVMFAIEYNKNEDIAAKNVFLSTLASVVLFPAILAVTYFR